MTSPAVPGEAHDQADEILRRRTDELDPVAEDLRVALLAGASPESLGLADDGLTTVIEERGIG